MKRMMTAALLTAALSLTAVLPAVAASNPSGTGQPSQTCLSSSSTMMEPGNAATAPGSAFNEDPGGTAGAVYANPDAQGGMSSGNSHVVAQYDVACFQVSQH